MREKARIVKIEGDRITVMPIDIEACIGCQNRECKANGNRFEAINARAFALSVGDEVRVGAPAKSQLAQAFFAVVLPALSALVVYVLFPRLVRGSGEGVRVAVTLATLVACAWARVRFADKSPPRLPEIIETL